MEQDPETPDEPTTAEPPPFTPDPDLITYIEKGREPAEDKAQSPERDG
jgi:hypothetical protein